MIAFASHTICSATIQFVGGVARSSSSGPEPGFGSGERLSNPDAFAGGILSRFDELVGLNPGNDIFHSRVVRYRFQFGQRLTERLHQQRDPFGRSDNLRKMIHQYLF